jgi:hypothetical protein
MRYSSGSKPWRFFRRLVPGETVPLVVTTQVRLHGGARLFEVVRPKPWDTRYYVRYSMIYSPNVNRLLR